MEIVTAPPLHWVVISILQTQADEMTRGQGRVLVNGGLPAKLFVSIASGCLPDPHSCPLTIHMLTGIMEWK